MSWELVCGLLIVILLVIALVALIRAIFNAAGHLLRLLGNILLILALILFLILFVPGLVRPIAPNVNTWPLGPCNITWYHNQSLVWVCQGQNPVLILSHP
jgi:hypothetical protein